MSKFNVGNKVVRLSTGISSVDKRIETYGIIVGKIYTVKRCNSNVQLEETGIDWWDSEYFKLLDEDNLELIWRREERSQQQIEYETLMAKIDELQKQAEKLKPV